MADDVFKGKVAVLACTGIGQVQGTIARQAAYRVCEDERPEATALLCLPALVKGVQEDLDMIEQCPVVTIEGCRERCAAHALGLHGMQPATEVSLPELLREAKTPVKREARRSLAQAERTVVEQVTRTVVAAVDRLRQEGDHEHQG